jgi:hypothetical protein
MAPASTAVVQVRGRRLQPVGWRLRSAITPVWSHAGFKWWSLVLADEGLAAVRLPGRRYWPLLAIAGLRAGVAHLPTQVRRDRWPLSEHSDDSELLRALLVPHATILSAVVDRPRFGWLKIRFMVSGRGPLIFTAADPTAADVYAELIREWYIHQ